jgi:hypothetical protein
MMPRKADQSQGKIYSTTICISESEMELLDLSLDVLRGLEHLPTKVLPDSYHLPPVFLDLSLTRKSYTFLTNINDIYDCKYKKVMSWGNCKWILIYDRILNTNYI